MFLENKIASWSDVTKKLTRFPMAVTNSFEISPEKDDTCCYLGLKCMVHVASYFYFNRDLNAIIHDYQILLHFMSKEEDCTLQMAGEPIKDAGYGFAVQKDDPKESWLSELIRRYQREGILQQLTTTWINTKCIEGKSSSTVTSLSSSDPSESSSDNHVDGAIDQFSASNFGGLLIILISSSFAAVFILFCEIQYSKRRQKVSQDLTAAIYTLNVKSVDLKEIKILDEDSAILYERKILNDIRLSPLVYSHKVIPSQEEEKYIT